MAKLDIISMIQNGFGTLSTNLTMIEKRLEKIEGTITTKNNLLIGNENTGTFPIDNFDPDRKLSKIEAAEILKISVRTLDRYRKKRVIPYNQYSDGGKIFFFYKDILAIRDNIKGNNHGRDYFSELTMPSK